MTFTDLSDGDRFADRTIMCIDCDQEFVWSTGEQAFYAERDLSQPKRCPDCRDANRDRKNRERAPSW